MDLLEQSLQRGVSRYYVGVGQLWGRVYAVESGSLYYRYRYLGWEEIMMVRGYQNEAFYYVACSHPSGCKSGRRGVHRQRAQFAVVVEC